MTYFEEIDACLTAILLGGPDDEGDETWIERVKKEIKDKIWESYRNGEKAGRRPKATARKDAPAEPKRKETDGAPRRFYHGR